MCRIILSISMAPLFQLHVYTALRGAKMLQTLLFFVQGILESAGIVACSLALARVKLRWGIILAAASVLTAVIYTVRSLPVTFGLHTLVAILLCVLFIARTTRLSPSTSFVVSFAGFALLAILEFPMFKLVALLLNTDINKAISDDLIGKLIGLPQAILMIVIALLISRYRKPMEGMWKI